ncbi:prephenate dehydrogenase/arogenate dehydrogenase family protein [Halosegnis marinus]|uniref:Prephenate dehydrogenase/arogenate dehydrogenase family protein n=1 Tax=Halosegnis marinus TaxID=3034023 RepID=A0ABD5ZRZ2_9EURY|nr:prephenate dehydrogenase/arogenate dehydrogenase family protein [Halosegnis sp. DT85]
MRVLVVGAGTMGRWLAAELAGDHAVAFADADADRAADAASSLDCGTDDGDRYDLLALAVPMSAVGAAARDYAGRADAVLDVTGEMRDTLAALRESFPDAERVSTHPLFAPGNAPGTVAVVTDAPGERTEAALDALAAAGNDLFETTAAEHDRAMETVQAKTHAAVLAFALAGEEVPQPFHTPVSGPLSDLADAVVSGDPRVYAEIQARFDGAERVAEAAERLAEADPEAFADLFAEARE